MKSLEPINRNIAIELIRVTELAALSAARYLGMGDKISVDKAAVNAMRSALSHVQMHGVIIIGEGEKDKAPMLYIGESIGDGSGIQVDVAVDPVDGTNLVARGLPGAVSVVALAPKGTIECPRPFVYMNKIATGPEGKDVVSIDAPVSENLNNLARVKKRKISEITAVVLDRPRHQGLIEDIRRAGARVKLISDGDVEASIHAALPDTGVDILMGVGGTPEAVLSAVAMHCIGGSIQCTIWPRDDGERAIAENTGVDLARVYTEDDLVKSKDVFFAITGVSTGELLRGVRYMSAGAQTQSLAMRGYSGTIRWIDSWHNFNRFDKLTMNSTTIGDA
jgi:fructose-1,6-bisphosphatase II